MVWVWFEINDFKIIPKPSSNHTQTMFKPFPTIFRTTGKPFSNHFQIIFKRLHGECYAASETIPRMLGGLASASGDSRSDLPRGYQPKAQFT